MERERPAAPRPPSVDAVARSIADVALPHPLLVEAAREAVAAGDPGSARARAESIRSRLLTPVVNATGVILHTNLGRAPISSETAARASNIELDLESGRRGSRQDRLGPLLARAAGAEKALVVNNGAAAVLLVVTALAAGRSVVVSRGELVEIGGGFRIPEVLTAAGATLTEVGTTNRTRLSDYEDAVAAPDGPALVLKVHPSNYEISGFTESVPVRALGSLGLPVVADLGSGLLDSSTPWLAGGPPDWLRGEPAVRQTLAEGASAVTFSGDKLLGCPQAGVIAGSSELVERCSRHPLARALRPGSLVLAALQETVLSYLRRDGDAIPFWRMATLPLETLRERALAVARASGVPSAQVVECGSVPGAGSAPGREIPSAGVALPGDWAGLLRSFDPPVIARVRAGLTICDLRSVDPADDALVSKALGECTS
ncbi:MAG: L-seryl-tRNA(Sec) selenium transferase [Acidimicrobiales bacterium]